MPIVYRKSAKGLQEIETRAYRLSPRLRQVLILVDGRRTDEDLRRLVATHGDESLHALAADGYIELVGITAMHAPARPVAVGVTGGAGAPAPSPSMAAARAPAPRPAMPSEEVPAVAPAFSEQLRRDAVRALTDQVGPVGEALALKIERARNADELRPLLEMALQSIRNTRGASAAASFGERFLGRPPR